MGFAEKFELIRNDRMGVVRSSVYPGIKTLVSQIYPDEAHFIYELIQNAEDAGASEVVFRIKSDMLIFEHNGKQFTDADIEGITNIGHSTKTDNYVQAGKFGIGFKSVYAFTETPKIFCDTINFKIENLLLPTEIESLKGKEKGWTVFHFPFNSPKISAEDAKSKIKHGLLEIESTTLLFLNNILTLKYVLEDGTEYEVIKDVDEKTVTTKLYEQGQMRTLNSWMRFSRLTKLHDKNITVDIAFPLEGTKEEGYRFVSGEDKVCITFLAKNEKSNLNFFINAPFGCTPARDTVSKEDADNKVLIEELSFLITDTIEELREGKLLTDEFFNLLPIEDDDVPEFYMPIVDAVYSTFREHNCLPTMNNEYVTVENGIMSSRNVIDKVFTLEDVQILFNNANLRFVKNRPMNSRAYKFLKMLHIEELTPVSALMQMVKTSGGTLEEWISALDNKRLVEMYAYFYKGIQTLRNDYEKYEGYERYNQAFYRMHENYREEYEAAVLFTRVSEQLEQIYTLRIVKDESGRFYQASEVRILVQDVEVPDEYKLVDKELLGKEEAVSFLKSIGVAEFTEKELEQYIYSQETTEFLDKINSVTSEDNPLDVVRMILHFLKKHKEKEVDFRETKYIFTNRFSGSGNGRKSVLASPGECYLDAPYIDETGFRFAENIHKKKALNEIYLHLDEEEREEWIDFLMRQGIYYTLRVEKQEYSTYYVTGYHHDYTVKMLKEYVELKNKVLNRFIWSFFVSSNGWNYYYAFETSKYNKNYSARMEESSILKVLKHSAWILDDSGSLRTPDKVSEENIAAGWHVGEDNGFLNAIGFGEEKRKAVEEERKQEELERLQHEEKQEAAAVLGFDNPEEVMAAKESLQVVAKLAELGVDVHELYRIKEKERSTKKYSIAQQLDNLRQNEFKAEEVFDDGEVYSVPNPERRQAKLETFFSTEKQPSKKVTLTKKTSINQEEKNFVGIEYSGKCQICSKVIYRRDGKRHFEAINLLDTGHLEEKYLLGLSTGWNTLCLCPNCAAEFKYGAVSLFDFEERVKQTEIVSGYRDFYEFTIQLQGESRNLRYTPRHLMALKVSLEYFEKNKEIDTVECVGENESALRAEDGEDILKEVTVVKVGDKCPICGKANPQIRKFTMYDKQQKMQIIDGRICSCGTKYLTHKQWKKTEHDIQIKLLEGAASVHSESQNGKVNSAATMVKCPVCGLPNGLFADKGMCWSCYKEEMSSRFD